jgi:predicted nucleic acid-binding protein
MPEDKIFIDTNIIIYAYDVTAGKKHGVAVNILTDLWNSGRGVISTQVLQEFFVNGYRKYRDR